MAERRVIMGYLENEAYRQGQLDELRQLAERFPPDVLPDPGDESDYYLGLSEAGRYIADRIAELAGE